MVRIFLVMFLAIFLLAGCSDSSREKAAEQALDKVHSQETSLPAEQLIGLYQAVMVKYPETQQAAGAESAIRRIKARQLYTRTAGQVLERVGTVLAGYQAFSGKLPQALKDLEADGYMFDSAYLAEILPDGAALYLQLAEDEAATQMWLLQTGQELVLTRSLASPKLEQLRLDELQALKSKWQELAKVGRLTQVAL